jgi:hypothetical protein
VVDPKRIIGKNGGPRRRRGTRGRWPKNKLSNGSWDRILPGYGVVAAFKRSNKGRFWIYFAAREIATLPSTILLKLSFRSSMCLSRQEKNLKDSFFVVLTFY